jgi:hypothetical protein
VPRTLLFGCLPPPATVKKYRQHYAQDRLNGGSVWEVATGRTLSVRSRASGNPELPRTNWVPAFARTNGWCWLTQTPSCVANSASVARMSEAVSGEFSPRATPHLAPLMRARGAAVFVSSSPAQRGRGPCAPWWRRLRRAYLCLMSPLRRAGGQPAPSGSLRSPPPIASGAGSPPLRGGGKRLTHCLLRVAES